MTDSMPKAPGKSRSRRSRKPRPQVQLPPPETGPDMTISQSMVAEVNALSQRLVEAINSAKQIGVPQGFIVAVLQGAALRETQLVTS
jgi:hypothetical protein